ncbi:hypothetical protein OJ995_03010 [Flavobacterium sp. TH16-21]|uniref:Lipoprotein n=1 Tax=Flavobacterium lacisediminis TaxID=2989705 RepID=A0ABT3EGD4_9FLAO|nr:hypothetical protein [Flavobacterium lacisediminis]
MKKKIIYSLIMLVLLTVSCGPRRYKCGPYRKCENSIEKNKNHSFYREFHKIANC